MSEKHYPYFGGSFDRIIFDGDGSVWVPEAEYVRLRKLAWDMWLDLDGSKLDREEYKRRMSEAGIEVPE